MSSKRTLGTDLWSIFDRFVVDLLIDLTHPQARWRRWPAGQLDIYPPPSPWGEHGVLDIFRPSSCQVLCKIFKILFRQPSALPEIAQIGPDPPKFSRVNFAFGGLCWPFLAQNSIKIDIKILIQKMIVFLLIFGGFLGQHEAPNPPKT